MGGVDEAVEDRVGKGRVGEVAVPLVDRELAGDDGGAGADAIVEDFEQIAARRLVERIEPPVVEQEDVALGELRQTPGVASVPARDTQLLEQPRCCRYS